MAQILRPDEDITINSYRDAVEGDENLYAHINDESDTTYVRGKKIGDLSCNLTVGLPVPPSTPGPGNSTVYFRIGSIFTSKNVKCEIFQGDTSKGSSTKAASTSGWVTESFSVALTDYSNLRIKLYGETNARTSEVWVEVPDAVSGIGLEMGCNF